MERKYGDIHTGDFHTGAIQNDLAQKGPDTTRETSMHLLMTPGEPRGVLSRRTPSGYKAAAMGLRKRDIQLEQTRNREMKGSKRAYSSSKHPNEGDEDSDSQRELPYAMVT